MNTRMNGSAASIDDQILSRVPGLNDASDNDGSETNVSSDTEDSSSGTDTSGDEGNTNVTNTRSNRSDESATPTRQSNVTRKETANAIDPKTGKPVAAVEKFADPSKPQTVVRGDKKGNLVNEQGEIVARSGNERRLYEKSQRFETQFKSEQNLHNQTREQARQLYNELTQAREMLGLARDSRLTKEDVSIGLRLVSDFRKNPAEFFKSVLTQMTAAGHDVSKYLPEAGAAAISPEGIQTLIQRELQNALGPVKQTREAEIQEQQQHNEIVREYNSFMAKFPDAAVHEDILAQLIQEDPNLSLDAAYYRLQSYAYKNGLDFSLPLRPQVEAKRTQPQQQQSRVQQPRPMPNGRGNVPVINNTPSFSHDSSWDDIISTSMRENGLAR